MMKTIKTLEKEVAKKLELVSKEEASLEAKIILSKVFKIKENELFLFRNKKVSLVEFLQAGCLVKKRSRGMPIYKVLGVKEFYNCKFKTTKNVLDPRPETEIIVDEILKEKDALETLNILEFGVGSGCIVLSILNGLKNSSAIAFDISKKAIKIAKKNSKVLGVKNKINLKNKSWNDISLKDFDRSKKFDLIISNPPYIKRKEINSLQMEVKKYDPLFALDGGEDGFDCYREIAFIISKYDLLMDSTGKIYLEIGLGQMKDVKKIFNEYGFVLHKSVKDFSNIDRILIFKKQST